MLIGNVALGVAGLAATCALGYWVDAGAGAISGAVGFVVGGFVASRQVLWKMRALRPRQ